MRYTSRVGIMWKPTAAGKVKKKGLIYESGESSSGSLLKFPSGERTRPTRSL